jgi:hypothetical protein
LSAPTADGGLCTFISHIAGISERCHHTRHVYWNRSLVNSFPRLALKLYPPDLCLLCIWDSTIIITTNHGNLLR